MKHFAIAAAVLSCLAAQSTLLAETWNKKTKVTFSQPFQIPAAHTSAGVITLGAGSYIFRLADSSSNRHIVQVTNERGDKVYSTILAIPDYRLNATSKTVMYFSERKAGSPTALKSWFYPGDNFGQRFVYPKAAATVIAVATNTPVPSYTPPAQPTAEPVETTKYVEVPVYIQTPAKTEIVYAPAEAAKTDATDTAGEDGEAVKAAARKADSTKADSTMPAATKAALPRTASSIYTMSLMGMLLLGASLLVRRISTQLS